MSTKIDIQLLDENTVKLTTVNDISISLDIFDAITSMNNGVVHGSIICNVLDNSTQVLPIPTSYTSQSAFLTIGGTSIGSTRMVLESGSTPIGPMNAINASDSVTIDGITFYGTKGNRLCFNCWTGASGVSGTATTANVKLTVIKINKTSNELSVSETYLGSQNKQVLVYSGSYGYIRGSIYIDKTEDEILLFAGVENIFE